jgi:hypothetical protein
MLKAKKIRMEKKSCCGLRGERRESAESIEHSIKREAGKLGS